DGAEPVRGADRAGPARGRDPAVLPRLRDVGHRGPGAARGPRRSEAGPPPDPLVDARAGPASGPPPPQVGERGRRRDEQVPPARRRADLRRPGPDGPGLLAAVPARGPARELRL